MCTTSKCSSARSLNRTMATFGRARRPALPVVAWSCAMATALLALATVVPVTSSENVTLLCRSTPYPRACETALTSAEARSAPRDDPFAASVQFAMARATTARSLAQNLSAPAPPSGMDDCAELLGISLAQLSDALAGSAADDADGATTWLSAALTNQGTCRDSLADAPLPDDPAGSDAVRRQVDDLERFISTALALQVRKVVKNGGSGGGGVPPSSSGEGTTFPSWLSEHDRRLLESPSPATPNDDIVFTPDAVVALDGSGTHTSINEAIAAVTAEVGTEASGGRGVGVSMRRKVIHVKAGRYEESVSISYKQPNVMLVGEGKGKTIIDGDKSVAGGYTTWSTATVGTY